MTNRKEINNMYLKKREMDEWRKIWWELKKRFRNISDRKIEIFITEFILILLLLTIIGRGVKEDARIRKQIKSLEIAITELQNTLTDHLYEQ